MRSAIYCVEPYLLAYAIVPRHAWRPVKNSLAGRLQSSSRNLQIQAIPLSISNVRRLPSSKDCCRTAAVVPRCCHV